MATLESKNSQVYNWMVAHSDAILANLATKSLPTVGDYKVVNLYIDHNTGKLVIEYDTTPQI